MNQGTTTNEQRAEKIVAKVQLSQLYVVQLTLGEQEHITWNWSTWWWWCFHIYKTRAQLISLSVYTIAFVLTN